MRTSPFRAFRTCRRVGARRRQRIVFTHREECGALELAGVAVGEVTDEIGAEAGGDPGRGLVSRRDQRFDAGDRIRRGHQRRCAGLAIRGQKHRLLAAPPGDDVPGGERGNLDQHFRRQREGRREPVGERALGNHGRNPRVACGGADDMPAGERGAPQVDPVWIDAVKLASVGDRVVPILQLAAHRQ